MPDTNAFLPLRRKAPAVAESDLPCARRGAAGEHQGSTRARVDLRASASPEPTPGRFFHGAGHAVAAKPSKRPDLNCDLENPRADQIGACVLIALAVLTATTELPLIWLARLAEALR